MVYMDTTTTPSRTTTRHTTVTMTTTTTRTTTTTKMPATTTAVAQRPRTTATTQAPVETFVEGFDPEDDNRAPPSSKLPNIRVEYCNPLVMMDISWPKTKQGIVAKMPCPPGTIGNTKLCLFFHNLFWIFILDFFFCSVLTHLLPKCSLQGEATFSLLAMTPVISGDFRSKTTPAITMCYHRDCQQDSNTSLLPKIGSFG